MNCDELEDIILPSSITTIENSCFWGCTSLTSVLLPETIKLIKNGAFRNCSSLKEITIPQSVDEIAYNVFEGCSQLSSIQIGSQWELQGSIHLAEYYCGYLLLFCFLFLFFYKCPFTSFDPD